MIEVHNKLVRDRIPEIIESTGRRAVTRALDGLTARTALLDKLAEEADELRESSAEDSAEEIADLLEVVRGLAHEYDVGWDEIVRRADEKALARGAFRNRVFLERVEDG